MLLVKGTSYTRAYLWLRSASEPEGITVEFRNKRHHNNIATLQGMVMRGWLEIKNSGPRGGKRYHATEKGREAIRCADLAMQVEQHYFTK